MATEVPATFPFLVAAVEEVEPPTSDRFGEGATELDRHVRVPGFGRAKEVQVTPQQLEDFWEKKVIALTNTLGAAQAKHETKGFRVDEISFGLGIGAKGGLLFVAEASIEATISVTLKRV
jgi:hypothetical protein